MLLSWGGTNLHLLTWWDGECWSALECHWMGWQVAGWHPHSTLVTHFPSPNLQQLNRKWQISVAEDSSIASYSYWKEQEDIPQHSKSFPCRIKWASPLSISWASAENLLLDWWTFPVPVEWRQCYFMNKLWSCIQRKFTIFLDLERRLEVATRTKDMRSVAIAVATAATTPAIKWKWNNLYHTSVKLWRMFEDSSLVLFTIGMVDSLVLQATA